MTPWTLRRQIKLIAIFHVSHLHRYPTRQFTNQENPGRWLVCLNYDTYSTQYFFLLVNVCFFGIIDLIKLLRLQLIWTRVLTKMTPEDFVRIRIYTSSDDHVRRCTTSFEPVDWHFFVRLTSVLDFLHTFFNVSPSVVVFFFNKFICYLSHPEILEKLSRLVTQLLK